MGDDNKWLWFDLDDTLHDFTYASSVATKKTIDYIHLSAGLDFESVTSRYRDVVVRHNAALFADGRASHEYRRDRIVGALGQSYRADTNSDRLVNEALHIYEEELLNSLILKDGCNDALEHLKLKGIKMIVVSDAPQDAQLRVIRRLNINNFFQDVFTSGRMRKCKADGLLLDVARDLKIDVHNVTMIGDSIKRDVNPALAIGMNAIWFNEDKKSSDSTSAEKIYSLRNLKTMF